MREEIQSKVRQLFAATCIYKNPDATGSLFAGRNLPSFVKDYLLKRFLNTDSGEVDAPGLTAFLDRVLPQKGEAVKDQLFDGHDVMLLARFLVYVDLVHGKRRFAIPDYGIKLNDGVIPDYVYKKYVGELVDGEKWGIVKLCLLPDDSGSTNHVEMVDYKPFKPYTAVDIGFVREARRKFSTEEWTDLLISAMEYDPDAFCSQRQKIEFLTRLLIFVEPRLNMVELAPKGTGKSYVMGNLSKYGWLVSGGKVTRAKLFYDKTRQQNGIMKNHDFTCFDEIQTLIFQEPAEIRAALKSYLESGKATIDNNEFSSECGLMLMGNIPLTQQGVPVSACYFAALPEHFRESALLDRFHGFIEGWLLPRVNDSMVFRGWTVNVEYFSEVLHTLRTQNGYNLLFDQMVESEPRADLRDLKAVKRVAVAYMKLLFPHWQTAADVDRDALDTYCLAPALRRRGIIKEQCRVIDPEFKTRMPEMRVREKK